MNLEFSDPGGCCMCNSIIDVLIKLNKIKYNFIYMYKVTI